MGIIGESWDHVTQLGIFLSRKIHVLKLCMGPYFLLVQVQLLAYVARSGQVKRNETKLEWLFLQGQEKGSLTSYAGSFFL